MAYYVLGVEPFNIAQVYGTHSNKKLALKHATILEQNKNKLCCQRYMAMTTTAAKRKYNLFI